MKKFLTLCLFAAASVVGAAAQPTLDECRRLAREHYPEISQYDLIARTEDYNLSNAARAWIPQLMLNAQATWQTDVPAYPDALGKVMTANGMKVDGMRQDQYKVAIDLHQNIWDGGRSVAERRIARAEAREQALATDVDFHALEGRVDNLYFGILLLDERAMQMESAITLLRGNLDRMRSLQRNGVAMQSDSDAIEAELLSAGQQLTQIEASRASYRSMLEIFVGQPVEGKLIRPEVTEPVSQEVVRPELSLFDAKIDKLAAQERLVRSASMPRFSLFAQGWYGYPGLNMFENMMNSDWSWNAIVGVRMSWNFGAYYTQKNNLNRLRTAAEQVGVQRDIFLFNTQMRIAEENGDIARLRKALSDDDRIVALRRSVRESAESKLANGVIDTTDLLQKITEENNAATARSVREIELLKTIYQLKHTINQ